MRMAFRFLVSALTLASTTIAGSQDACSSAYIQRFLPSHATVTFTQHQTDNSTFRVPAGNVAYPTHPTGLRASCAVVVNVTSSPSSAFSFGLFLPDEWNSRFLAVGNGGFAGGINWLDMGAGLGYGFATMSTDTGHSSASNDITWALNQPEKRTDWGWRAMHSSVVLAKEIVSAYYSQPAIFSYYSGCSTGGRQGLKDIQLFPDDFDGVLAGAPAWWTKHLQTWTTQIGLWNLPTTAEWHIQPELFPVIEKEILRQCDASDGLNDTIISDPRACNPYLEALLCPYSDDNATIANTTTCLTAPQIETLYKIYNDYKTPNSSLIFPRLELGSEYQWNVLLGRSSPNNLGQQYVQYFLLNEPDWSFYNFNYSIVELADRLDPGNATADTFDLSPFHERGGKLLHYHGLADALISTGASEYFYKQVLSTMRTRDIDLDEWYRLFLVPGMGHCGGTSESVNAPWYFAGANQAADISTSISGVPGFHDPEHDALLALMRWTENGTAPDRIVATKWVNDTLQDEVLRQRPLCPFPSQAKWDGEGDVDDAATWRCRGI